LRWVLLVLALSTTNIYVNLVTVHATHGRGSPLAGLPCRRRRLTVQVRRGNLVTVIKRLLAEQV
jgi:hypothetical protein